MSKLPDEVESIIQGTAVNIILNGPGDAQSLRDKLRRIAHLAFAEVKACRHREPGKAIYACVDCHLGELEHRAASRPSQAKERT